MAGAAPAYRYDYVERERYHRAPDVRVVRGRGAHATPLNPQLVTLAKIAAAVLVVIALVCCVRVALTAATVTTGTASDELSTQISEVRSSTSDLEVRQSMLANPTNVKREAQGLGMVEATDVTSITLPEDVVQTGADGDLSLSKSLAVAASQAG
ncbi:MAG TPA: cell division protein FtsL [Candidatus Aveggerthella excrementigallinarum]|nr:cell division protein FtsL [Candidatus Aveggerthella excrementigallinarum]